MNRIQQIFSRIRLFANSPSIRIALLLMCVFLSGVGLHVALAQVNFTFTPTSAQIGTPGQILNYQIHLTNGTFTSTLLGFNFTLDGNDLTIDSSPFESFLTDPTTPDPLPPNYAHSNLSAFAVALGSNVQPGIYSGTATITFETDATVADVSQDFKVLIQPAVGIAPEPPALFLLGIVLVLFGLRRLPMDTLLKTIRSLFSAIALACVLCTTPTYAQTGYRYLRTIAPPQTGQFHSPESVAVDPAGNIFVADSGNARIQKFDKNGTFLLTFGSRSHPQAQLGHPTGVAVDASGNVYVANLSLGTIVKFDNEGTFISKFGSNGSGTGQFSFISGVAVDSTGNIYVADAGHYCIQKFDKNGKFLLTFGTKGTGNGQFGRNTNIALDRQGNVYVADQGNYRVQKFDKNGKFLLTFASLGSNNGQFPSNMGIAVDDTGNIYLTDIGTAPVLKFDKNGKFLLTFGARGAGDGQLDFPHGLTLDGSGNVLIADRDNHRVQKFDKSGKFLSRFGQRNTLISPKHLAFDRAGNLVVADGNRIVKFDKYGYLLSSFSLPIAISDSFYPFGIAVDSSDNIFTSENTGNRIRKFDKNGTFLLAFGQLGSNNGEFSGLAQITTDATGNLYVVDTGNHRIQKFNGQGVFLGQIRPSVFGGNLFSRPEGIAFDKAGNFFVSDFSEVHKFNAQEQYLLTSPVRISFPGGLATDQDGYLYVGEYNEIRKIRNDGTFVLSFGQYGDGEGQLALPLGILLDTDGNIYVADATNDRIVVFAPDPARLDLVRTPLPTVTRDASTGDLLVTISVINMGSKKATNGRILGARLGKTSTKTSLPITLPNIATRDATKVVLRFPNTAAASNTSPFVFVDLTLGTVKTTTSTRTGLVP